MTLSTPLPTPVDVPPAHIVRIRLGGHCYHSKFMPPAEAAALARKIDRDRQDNARYAASIEFETADDRTVRIAARSISAIENGPPPAHWRDRQDALDAPIDLVPIDAHGPSPIPGPWAQAQAAARRPSPVDVPPHRS